MIRNQPPRRGGDDPAHPPPWVFLGALALAVAMVLGLSLWGEQIQRAQAPVTPQQLLGVSRLDKAHDRRPTVVALGTSRVASALLHDEDFERLPASAGAVRFIRVARPSADLPALSPLFQALLASPPTLLLVEAELLVMDRGPVTVEQPSWLKERLRHIRSTIWLPVARIKQQWLGRPQDLSGLGEGLAANYYADCDNADFDPAARAVHQALATGWKVAGTTQYEPYLALFAALQARGTQVVLLDIPLSPDMLPYPTALREGLESLKVRLAEHGRLLLWRLDPGSPLFYCDAGHSNRWGQRFYSEQVAQRIGRVLPGP